MGLTSQFRIIFMIGVLPSVLIGCESLPQLEKRLRGFQLSQNTYLARPGDTWETVAFRYRLDRTELSAMNPQLPEQLVVGQRIVVHPTTAGTLSNAQPARAAVAQSSATERADSQTSPTRTTISSAIPLPTQIINAPVYDQPEIPVINEPTSSEPKAPENPVSNASNYVEPKAPVSYEQIREIPANSVVTPAGSSIAAQQPIEEVVPDEWNPESAYNSLPPASEYQINAPATTEIVASPRGKSNDGWVWPTWGEIAREFSPTETGGHGIDIAGIPGQEIHAASGGTIAYAGRELSGGDGKLIIIRHDGGLMTTYAHASQLFVAEDDVVRAGDVIASLGANARQESVLSFEVRQHGNPLNPMNFLTY